MVKKSVLVINPGSATIKWAWFSHLQNDSAECQGHYQVRSLADSLPKLVVQHPADIYLVRYVHGGPTLFEPLLVSEFVLDELKKTVELAPLHNKISLDCLKVLKSQLPESCPLIVVFDTEFFQDLPLESQSYGLPQWLTHKYDIRRYGFHGFAHSAMCSTWDLLRARIRPGMNQSKLVTVQLGSGCSMAAILDGEPIETSMGFTPNEGLLMSTRTGNIDPGLVTYLQRHEHWTPEKTDQVLNLESGWLGVSSESANMKDLLESEAGNARLARKIFSSRIRKTLGSYYALLGGLDAVIFSGGIAEHSSDFCVSLMSKLEHLGIRLGTKKVEQEQHSIVIPVCLSAERSLVSLWVVPNNEASAMLASFRASRLAPVDN